MPHLVYGEHVMIEQEASKTVLLISDKTDTKVIKNPLSFEDLYKLRKLKNLSMVEVD